MKKYSLVLLVTFLLVVGGLIVWKSPYIEQAFQERDSLPVDQSASVAAVIQSPFHYAFSKDGSLEELGDMDKSTSPYWWLNSGGRLLLKNGVGKTIQGELEELDKWRLAFAASKPIDTDNGYHPQNLFRLVTRSKWQNFNQELYFKITKLNLSISPNRYNPNGILLFNRYQNGDNLYYTGIRVDGAAVIKKKTGGVYYTLAYKSFYNNSTPYSRDINPNLIPVQKWIGLKSEVKTNLDNTVSIKLFIDKDKTGNWVLATEAKDDGKTYGGAAILNEGYAGIRTDFMDAEFDDYRMVKL